MYYDLHVHTSLSIGEHTTHDMADTAAKLGLHGIGIVSYFSETLHDLPERTDIDVIPVIMLKPQHAHELAVMAEKARSKCVVLMVHGGDYDINRAACENPMIDVVCHPELGRRDSGLDHVCVKAAKENDVAIEVNFREILQSHKQTRVSVLSSLRTNIRLCKAYGTKMITTSSAVTKWGLRSGRDLASFSHLLGLELSDAIASVTTVPETIVKTNREKLAGKRWGGIVVEE